MAKRSDDLSTSTDSSASYCKVKGCRTSRRSKKSISLVDLVGNEDNKADEKKTSGSEQNQPDVLIENLLTSLIRATEGRKSDKDDHHVIEYVDRSSSANNLAVTQSETEAVSSQALAKDIDSTGAGDESSDIASKIEPLDKTVDAITIGPIVPPQSLRAVNVRDSSAELQTMIMVVVILTIATVVIAAWPRLLLGFRGASRIYSKRRIGMGRSRRIPSHFGCWIRKMCLKRK